MRKVFASVIICTLICILISGGIVLNRPIDSYASPVNPDFNIDFGDGGMLGWTPESGVWYVNGNNHLEGIASGYSTGTIFLDNIRGTDFSYKVDAQLVSG